MPDRARGSIQFPVFDDDAIPYLHLDLRRSIRRLLEGGIGVALGLIGAAIVSQSMTTMLFNVKPTDPGVYAAVSLVLVSVALLASYLPARRAARIDPLIALRDE